MTSVETEVRPIDQPAKTDQDLPKVTRNERGRVMWQLPGNTPEENEQLGIRNVQALFIEKFPEFSELFPLGEDGKIIEEKREEAKAIILERVGTQNKFKEVFGSSPIKKMITPYFSDSFYAVVGKVFSHWGIVFEERKPNPRGYWKNLANIELEAQKFFSEGHSLTSGVIRETGHSSLEKAIHGYYPGGIAGLRHKMRLESPRRPSWQSELNQKNNLPVQRDMRGRIRWTVLSPEQRVQLIEKEAQALVSQDFVLRQKELSKKGRSDLVGAITKHYPGGLAQLKINLNISRDRVPEGYWTKERIMEEAKEFYQKEGKLTQKLLSQKKRSDLLGAIRIYYPGGLVQLKIDVGIKLSERPKRYWTPDTIEQEAIDFANEEGGLSDWLLEKKGAGALRVAIQKKYPGGITQLKVNLGIQGVSPSLLRTNQRPSGYWNMDRIKQESQYFYEERKGLSLKLLEKGGRKELVAAIRKRYPGGIRALKRDLGIRVEERRPKGYWSLENIQREARVFYETYGKLTARLMDRNGKQGLTSVISRKYPGGWTQLKKDLLISPMDGNEAISPEEANEQLRRLLEG